MLHPFDDHPLHQTPEPFLHTLTESPNAYDRFFYNGHQLDDAGTPEVFFAAAFGVYPNRQVMDGAFSVVRGDRQVNVRGSRRCPLDRTRTTAGPVTVEIIEPMRRHRLIVDGDQGLTADLEWTSISPAIEEPRFIRHAGNRLVMDYTRLTQFGRWTGWIELDGDRITIDTATGVRDRSWGVRAVGHRIDGPNSRGQFFWLWGPTVFDDACTHFARNDDASGQPWHSSGVATARIGPGDPAIDDSRVSRGTGVDVAFTWEPGTRWVSTITSTLERWNAEPVVVTYEPVLRFHMSGIGYGHPVWRHGAWIGDDAQTRDEIDLKAVDPEDPTMIHIQALSRATWGDRTGWGVVEQLVVGPHESSGLTGTATGHGNGG
ncbi:MAG: hypothetical protein ACK5RL_15290 [Acidimicrobiales bacterium]